MNRSGKPVTLLPQTLAMLICTALWGGWVFAAFHLGWVYAQADSSYAASNLFALGSLGIAVSAYGWPMYCRINPEADAVRFRSGFFGALLLAMAIAFGVLKGYGYSSVAFGSLGACLLLDWALKIRLLQDLRLLKWIAGMLVPAVLLIYLDCRFMGITVLSALHINLMLMGIPIEHIVLALPLILLPIVLDDVVEKLLQKYQG